jgi:hypothetical protein
MMGVIQCSFLSTDSPSSLILIVVQIGKIGMLATLLELHFVEQKRVVVFEEKEYP